MNKFKKEQKRTPFVCYIVKILWEKNEKRKMKFEEFHTIRISFFFVLFGFNDQLNTRGESWFYFFYV